MGCLRARGHVLAVARACRGSDVARARPKIHARARTTFQPVSRRALLADAALRGLGHAPAGSTHAPRFVIALRKHANVVHHDARLDGRGKLDTARPIAAYWIMHAEDGRREELAWARAQVRVRWVGGARRER